MAVAAMSLRLRSEIYLWGRSFYHVSSTIHVSKSDVYTFSLFQIPTVYDVEKLSSTAGHPKKFQKDLPQPSKFHVTSPRQMMRPHQKEDKKLRLSGPHQRVPFLTWSR
ncbi:hypothetical protein AMTR_s00016p00238150 [Amborella trichopoda]|uniref:Uncharacterized protein n=1 Tax=Amborella trichopoda TaxID=13333 RepID=W1PFB9_AMBTC|nr:hypothetical protein AMTR_s00016p00238150 [Amborella trichopoda]